jgi:hypothetical protein
VCVLLCDVKYLDRVNFLLQTSHSNGVIRLFLPHGFLLVKKLCALDNTEMESGTTSGPISEWSIYFEYPYGYLTVIIFNNEIIQKILTIYVKNISHLLIECICCVSESI